MCYIRTEKDKLEGAQGAGIVAALELGVHAPERGGTREVPLLELLR
jgi:hypothetical protein